MGEVRGETKRQDLSADCLSKITLIGWLIAFVFLGDCLLVNYQPLIVDFWYSADCRLGKGRGWSPRCPLFDRRGLDGHFDSSRVLLQGDGDNRTSIQKLIQGGVVVESKWQSNTMHLPSRGVKKKRIEWANGNAIKLQWLVARSKSQKECERGKVQRGGKRIWGFKF